MAKNEVPPQVFPILYAIITYEYLGVTQKPSPEVSPGDSPDYRHPTIMPCMGCKDHKLDIASSKLIPFACM